MITNEQITLEFNRELRDLLRKYDAKLAIEDSPRYSEFNSISQMVVTVPAKWNEEYELVQEWTEINLGRYVY